MPPSAEVRYRAHLSDGADRHKMPERSKGHPVGVVVRLRNCTSKVCDECQAAWCELKSVAQPGSTAKAAYSLARSCPIRGAWVRYWRLCGWWRRGSEKNNGPTPMERLCKGRRPGRAELNSPWKIMHESQATGERQESNLPPNAKQLARDVQVQQFIVQPGDSISVAESIW